jgi:hypothetical protein
MVAPSGPLLFYLMLSLLGIHYIVHSSLLEICVHLMATKWFDPFLLEIYLHLVATRWLNVFLFEVIST